MTTASSADPEIDLARTAFDALNRSTAGRPLVDAVLQLPDVAVTLPQSAVASLRDVLAFLADGREVEVVSHVAGSEQRPSCAGCGEPVELADPADPESWIHAPDANDQADHTAWLDNLDEQPT